MAATYQVKLIDKRELARETFGFYFEKPEGFHYKSGQTLRLTLLNPPETDEQGNTRIFTIASAPYEKNILTASRLRDTAFKRVLKSLPLNSKVEIRGPYGDFLLHQETAKPAVFLAGGIGITPFRSMLVQNLEEKLPYSFFLFYSNRKPEDAAFLEEFHLLKNQIKKFTFIPIMTTVDGHLNGDMIKKHLGDLTSAVYYVVGPPAMVSGMREVLQSLAVPSDQIKIEEFEGYSLKPAPH
jgi:ferredoxin-NADP reductase